MILPGENLAKSQRGDTEPSGTGYMIDEVIYALFLFLLETHLAEQKDNFSPFFLSLKGKQLFVLRQGILLGSGARGLRAYLCFKSYSGKSPNQDFLRVLSSSRKDARIILKREEMEGNVSQEGEICLCSGKMGSQAWTFPAPKCVEQFSIFCCTTAAKGQSMCYPQAKLGSCPILKPDSWGTTEIEGTLLSTCKVM